MKSGALDDNELAGSDCRIDLGTSALIPEDYVPDVHTRLALYQRLTACETAEAVDALKSETIDRFGALPEAAENLFANAGLRIAARALGITQLRVGESSLSVDFGSDNPLDPVAIIGLVQSDPRAWRMEGENRLIHRQVAEDDAARVRHAREVLQTLAGTARHSTDTVSSPATLDA